MRSEQAVAHIAAIIEGSDDAVISKTPQGIIQSWNAAATRVYGYEADEAIGRPTTMMIPDDRLHEETDILARIARGERVEHFETVRRRKDGSLVDVSLTISPIRNGQGVIEGVSQIARDISERKRIDQQLMRMAAIIESTDDAVISKTLEGRILTWNSGAQRLYGYSEAEMIGQPMSLLLPEGRPDEETEILDRIARGETVEHLDTVRRKKDGSAIEVSLTISPILDREGRIAGVSHIARGITERRRAHRQLQQFAAIIESSEDAIISKTLDGTILTWNPGAERTYGYSAEEVIGRSMTILLPPDRPDEEAEILARIARGDRVAHFETTRRRKSGEVIDVSLTISPIRDATGTIVGASHISRNVTERRKLDEQLRHTQKLESLGVLAGGVAHDFNNLLVGIMGNTSLALEVLSTDNPARTLIRDAMNASERASHLTRQLLAYAGKGRFVVEPVDLSSLVREISNLIQASIPKNVQLRLDLRPGMPVIQADASQLQQIAMNLVINGAEAIPEEENGTVLVTTGVLQIDTPYLAGTVDGTHLTPGTYVSLEVHDTGRGMDEATIARIFDPFFTTKFTGRGLGLAATLGIIRGHKGAIKVYSRPGKGTTFKVLFPVSGDRARPIPTAPPSHLLSNDELILVVDDEEVIRKTAKAMLERYGYSVVLAENGKEGVELLEVLGDKVQAVVLDMTMPLMSGEEAFSQMRRIRPDIKVILSSGYNEVETIRRFTGKGLAGFLQKPYSSAVLAEKVASILGERSQ
ncbi:MAG TPA: PAS domain S-box protein [Bryobacteraceae bacterium]|nr:PAS domain S-box protein [Bryobacteraceae bacterium]